ncbi:ATP-binding cassette domain-containing protein [Propionibacteriaceae bacterium Y2011]
MTPLDPDPQPRHAAPEVVPDPESVARPVLIELTALTLSHRAQAVFGPITTTVPRGGLVVAHGPAGSGRSSFLLALAGRMRGLTGTLAAPGPVPADARARRRVERERRNAAAVARVGTLVTPEDRLTVGESITERCLIDAVTVADGHTRFAELVAGLRDADLPGPPMALDHDTLVGELSARDRAVFAVLLAMLRRADLVVLDDADDSLDTDQQAELYAALQHLSATGCTVVASTCDLRGVPAETPVITLPSHPEPTHPEPTHPEPTHPESTHPEPTHP